MKNRKVAIWILIMTVFLTTAIGCGGADSASSSKPENAANDNLSTPGQSEENEVPKADEVSDGFNSEEYANNLNPEDSDAAEPTDEQNGSSQKEAAYLLGNVKSVSGDSIVVSQAFEEEKGVLVSPAEGSSDEVLVTVYLLESTQYEVKTVKNGGVNGDADVERRQGDVSDLKEKISVEISGYYEDGRFFAEEISISLFV